MLSSYRRYHSGVKATAEDCKGARFLMVFHCTLTPSHCVDRTYLFTLYRLDTAVLYKSSTNHEDEEIWCYIATGITVL